MKTEEEWAEQAKRLFKVEMKRHGLTYDDLAERLRAIGVEETSANIRNKVARGKFSAVFLLQAMEAMKCKKIDMIDISGD